MGMRLLILAGVGLYREALAESLGRDQGIEVVGVAPGLEETLAALENDRSEMVLVDTLMPGAVDAVRALVAAAPQVKVVAFAVPEDERDVIAFAEAGASGYVVRGGSIDDLVAVIESVSRGEMPPRRGSRRRRPAP